MPDGSLLKIIIMLICLAFSAFFSSSETAFTSMNHTKLKNLASEGNKKAALVMKMSDNYDKLLSTILVGNNIVNIALSSIATIWFMQLLANGPVAGYYSAISTIITTVVVLIFGEITPKMIARRCSDAISRLAAYPLMVLMVVLFPAVMKIKLKMPECMYKWQTVLHF